jgi:signal transduction histidine kinase
METRIDELLDLARGEVGMLKVELEPLDMAELLSGIVREIKPAAEARRLELVLELAELLLVNGNRDRLRLVLVNLISNAIKYTDRGQIRIIARDFASENLLVRVEDTGRGLSEEQIKQLFDPFRRPSTDGQKYSGLGIGLALCKLYIELHHGKIWVESEQGKGARFSFTVPVFQEKTDLPNKSQNAASR